MTAQIVAAALVADCRVLATPASVQSVPTEGNQEDVVPMGMSAAWKAERILANATRIVAIELLAAAQGLEFLGSEEHTSELQSLAYLVCRLLLEKKNRQRWRCRSVPRSPAPHDP